MSAAPRLPIDGVLTGLRMTADEYLAVGETKERYELIDGVVCMSPSPTTRHQKIIARLFRQLDRHAERAGGEVLMDTDVRLGGRLVYRPDIVYYAPGRFGALPKRLDIPPDLVVEVLSRGSKALDLITKKADYERFGVRGYWVVNPEDGSVRAWARDASGAFAESRAEGDRLASASIVGFTLDLVPLRLPAG